MFPGLSSRKTTDNFLTQIRIFTMKDLWLFLLGIIFVSITSGSIGAFMLGVGAEEFFMAEQDNVVIVTQPGISTPFTGQVPLSLQTDIQKIPGVIVISPETLGLTVAQNLDEKSIVVRGVSSNFSSIVTSRVLAGMWFDPQLGETNKIVINGAMAGYILANNLKLSVGDTLILAGTLSNSVIELTITGILRTDSPSDEELIVSMPIGRTISGKDAGYVSFLRVLINTDVISKPKLANILSLEYLVPITLATQDPELITKLEETPIIAVTPYGHHVKTQYIETDNTTFFNLRFGTYDFIAAPPNASRSEYLRVFVNHDFYTPFELVVGYAYRDLQIQVQNNNQPVFNASVTLSERFGCVCIYSSQTNVSGVASFQQIPNKPYHLYISYANIDYHTFYSVTQSTTITINLNNSFTLNILNYTTGDNINGGELTISLFNSTEIYNSTNYLSNSTIFLDPGVYLFNYSYAGYVRNFILPINGEINKTIFLGSDLLQVWVLDPEGLALPANVSILNRNQTVAYNITDINGLSTFNVNVDQNYTISAVLQSNQSKIHTHGIYFTNTSDIVIVFYDSYILHIHVENGTLELSPMNELEGITIELRKNSAVIATGSTNSTGDYRFILPDPGSYNIYAVKDGFSWNKSILIFNQTTNNNISLGQVHLKIYTESVNKIPISNIGISIFNSTSSFPIFLTNSSGLKEINIPIGNYSIMFTTVGYLFSTDLNVTYSQILWVNQTIESCGNLYLKLENQLFQNLDNAFIYLRNDYFDYNIRTFTNIHGEVFLESIPWGTYSVQITHSENLFPTQTIEFASNYTKMIIRVDTEGPILNAGYYAFWQDRGFSVVWSSEFISGFLETTLSLITTTLTTLVIIVSVLSLLSIASIISHPIVSNERSILTLQCLGANRQQITINVVSHLVLLGLLASIVGALLGMGGMTLIPQFQHINIGGVIIKPRIDFWLFMAILVSNIGVISIKAGQKVNELFSRHLPKNTQPLKD